MAVASAGPYMQVCTLLQTDNHASTPPLSIPFLPPNQQRQSTDGTTNSWDDGLLFISIISAHAEQRMSVLIDVLI